MAINLTAIMVHMAKRQGFWKWLFIPWTWHVYAIRMRYRFWRAMRRGYVYAKR